MWKFDKSNSKNGSELKDFDDDNDDEDDVDWGVDNARVKVNWSMSILICNKIGLDFVDFFLESWESFFNVDKYVCSACWESSDGALPLALKGYNQME